MKHRPIYFAAAFLLLLLICTAYNLSYHYITGNPPSAEESADHENETIRSAPVLDLLRAEYSGWISRWQ